MSLFGDLDVANAEDNPFEVAAGTYEAVITDVKTQPTKDGSKVGLIIEYTLTEDQKKISEWKEIPQKGSPTEARASSFLKMRLASLGIPESKMNSIEADDLVNLEVVITVKKNGEYSNVNKVTLNEGPAASTNNPFAS